MAAKNDSDMKYRQNRQQTFEEPVKVKGVSKSVSWIDSHDESLVGPLIDSGFYYSPIKSNLNRVLCSYCHKPENVIDESDVSILPTRHYEKNKNCSLSLVLISSLARDQHKSRSAIVKYWTTHEQNIIRHPLSEESKLFRLESYGKDYPLDKLEDFIPNSKSLSEAGFVYSPVEFNDDRVVCIYCGSSLDHWEEEDVPIEEHASNTKFCYFLDQYNQAKKTDETKSKNSKAKSKSKPAPKKKNVFLGLFSDEAEENNYNSPEEVLISEEEDFKSPEVIDSLQVSQEDEDEDVNESVEGVGAANDDSYTSDKPVRKSFLNETKPQRVEYIESDEGSNEPSDSDSDMNDDDFTDESEDEEVALKSDHDSTANDTTANDYTANDSNAPLRRSARVRRLRGDGSPIKEIALELPKESSIGKKKSKSTKKESKVKKVKNDTKKIGKKLREGTQTNVDFQKIENESPSKSKKLRLVRRSFSPAIPVFAESDEEIDEYGDDNFVSREERPKASIKRDMPKVETKLSPFKLAAPSKRREFKGIDAVVNDIVARPFRTKNEPSIFDTSFDLETYDTPTTSKHTLSIRNLPIPESKSINQRQKKEQKISTWTEAKEPENDFEVENSKAKSDSKKASKKEEDSQVSEDVINILEDDEVFADAEEQPEIERYVEEQVDSVPEKDDTIEEEQQNEIINKQEQENEDISMIDEKNNQPEKSIDDANGTSNKSARDSLNSSKRDSFKAKPFFTFDESAEEDKDVDLSNVVQDITDINKEIAKRMKLLFDTAQRKKQLESSETVDSKRQDSEFKIVEDEGVGVIRNTTGSNEASLDGNQVKFSFDRQDKDSSPSEKDAEVVANMEEDLNINQPVQSVKVDVDSTSMSKEVNSEMRTRSPASNKVSGQLSLPPVKNDLTLEKDDYGVSSDNRPRDSHILDSDMQDVIMKEPDVLADVTLEPKLLSSAPIENLQSNIEDSDIDISKNSENLPSSVHASIDRSKIPDEGEEEVQATIDKKEKLTDNIAAADVTARSEHTEQFDGLSGNFSDLSSSTPQKQDVFGRELIQFDDQWVSSSLSPFIERLNIIRDAVEEFSELASSGHDLVDDPGKLTRFIAEMPDNEKEMTIKEWMDDAASICHGLVLELCGDMNEHLIQGYRRAISKVEEVLGNQDTERDYTSVSNKSQ
ncbi:hypothetical protein DFJ63DRAFT_256853 [Scheffersomyces coipomensis]|uniref:uncharacterized protein n=1 Tax=Scheffersomyces coipomensis TaxID=1788519 RepID=UPI00315C7A7C